MRRILIATTNTGKTREILQALAGVPHSFVTLREQPVTPEPDETETTFAGNARLKARYYASRSGLATVAEDSGLAIDALQGRPGVASARYPGETYADKFKGLYRELSPNAVPWTARYICALAYAEPGDSADAGGAAGPGGADAIVRFESEGRIEGLIARAPRGSHGFGYDPIFYYPPFGLTLGEVDDARKLTVSHRGHAFAAFREWLVTERGT